MPTPSTPEDAGPSRKRWVIFLGVASLLLAIFWSVDSSISYILLGAIAFGFFKVLSFKRTGKQEESDEPIEPVRQNRYVPPSQQTQATKILSSLSPQQKKAVLVFIIGFFGFVFFFILVGTLIDFITSSFEGSIEYQQKASDFYFNQQYDSSAFYYRLAIQNNPEDANLWFERGNAFLNAQQADSALVMYREALQLKPDFDQAQYNIGYILYDRKNFREAIAETRKILEYNPGYIDAQLLIGDSYYNSNQFDSALHWYEGAYETGYRNPMLCYLMAYIYDTKGQTTVAIDLYKEAIQQDTTLADVYSRLGELVSGQEGEAYRTKAAYLNAQRNP